MTLASMSNNILRFSPGLNLDLVKSTLQDSYRQLCLKDWNRLKLTRQIYTVAPYATGKVFIDAAGIVTGIGTTFTADMVGRHMKVYYGDSFFEIQTYTSPTSITLKDWPGEAIPTVTACVANNAADTFTSVAHGLTSGGRVYILAATLPTGISSAIQYYVLKVDVDTFQVSLTLGGSAVTFTTDGTLVKWAQTLEAFSIFKIIYIMDSSFKLIWDVVYQIPLKKKSQAYFNKIDPTRTSTASSPISWALAGLSSAGLVQIEIYPVPSQLVPLRVYGKMGFSTLADGDTPKLPEDLIEAHALMDCFRIKDLKEPGQGWDQKEVTQRQRYAESLADFEEEDYQLGEHSDRVKDRMGEVGFPQDDNFALSHDVE